MILSIRISWTEGADKSLPLPAYSTQGSAGADLRANLAADARQTGLVVGSFERVHVPLGFRIEIPAGYEAQIRPRSGLALRRGLTVLNSPGTIDRDYRGEVGVLLANLGKSKQTVKHGDRIAQMVFAPVATAEFEPADELPESARGQGGFGSTGLR